MGSADSPAQVLLKKMLSNIGKVPAFVTLSVFNQVKEITAMTSCHLPMGSNVAKEKVEEGAWSADEGLCTVVATIELTFST